VGLKTIAAKPHRAPVRINRGTAVCHVTMILARQANALNPMFGYVYITSCPLRWSGVVRVENYFMLLFLVVKKRGRSRCLF